jgi:hypothetical protein
MVAWYDDDDDDDLLMVVFLSHRTKAYGCLVYITWTCTDTGCTSPLIAVSQGATLLRPFFFWKAGPTFEQA